MALIHLFLTYYIVKEVKELLIPNQMVRVHWCPANKNHYESKGYEFTAYRKPLMVRVEDLMPTSTIKVRVKCDYCGEEYITSYKLFLKGIASLNKNACKNCSMKKIKEVNYNNLGVENPFYSEKIQLQIKKTNLENYGFENPGQVPEIKKKIAETNLQKYGNVCSLCNNQVLQKAKNKIMQHYGTRNVFESSEIQERIKKTIREKYNCDNVSQSPIVQEKTKQTNLKKRGVPYSFQDPEVIAKIRKSLTESGTVPTSKAERIMCDTLVKLYGKENCYPSFPYDRITFDCFIEYKGIKIDVEYDGWYWHKDTQVKDNRRNCYVMRRGIKVLRFQANKSIPTKKQLSDSIEELVKSSEMLKIVKLDV